MSELRSHWFKNPCLSVTHPLDKLAGDSSSAGHCATNIQPHERPRTRYRRGRERSPTQTFLARGELNDSVSVRKGSFCATTLGARLGPASVCLGASKSCNLNLLLQMDGGKVLCARATLLHVQHAGVHVVISFAEHRLACQRSLFWHDSVRQDLKKSKFRLAMNFVNFKTNE